VHFKKLPKASLFNTANIGRLVYLSCACRLF